jgi:hypothetical protein
MLLRSVTQHVRDQNWFAVFIDFLIVVVGVFIGIQVANLNESRQDLAKEQIYIERLHEELTVIIERLESGTNQFDTSVNSLQTLLSARKQYKENPDSYQADEAHLKSAFNDFKHGRIPASSPAVFKEMISNGELALIRNQKLRQDLYKFDEYSNVAFHAWGTLRDHLIAVLPATVGILTYKVAKNDGEVNRLSQYISPDEFNLKQFLTQPGLSGTLSSIMEVQANQLMIVNNQLELARAIQKHLMTGGNH